MRAAAFLHPWDVAGDPQAPGRMLDLGVQAVSLASAYHSTRALTARHPEHRIITAEHAAVYYPLDEERWSGQILRPYPQRWLAEPDPYGAAAHALRDAGLEVHSWVVLAHNSRMGSEHPSTVVRNAYGDRYPWAPCIAHPEVKAYCTELAAEAAVRPDTVGTELESCGWYGLAHLHAHDKINGVQLDGVGQYLMSLCFCEVCRFAYAHAGAFDLADAVRTALAPRWRGEACTVPPDADAEWAEVEKLLGSELAQVTLRHRMSAVRAFQSACIAAIRRAAGPAFRILLHADPAPHRSGPNPGVEADWLLGPDGGADGLVLPCTGTAAAVRQVDSGLRVANLPIVSGLGGRPDLVAEVAAEAASFGAGELRLHHAGTASDADLALVRAQLAQVR